MKLLIILLLLSVQGYAQQITEAYVTVEIRNPHALTAPQVPIGIAVAPVIDQASYPVKHFTDSLMINHQVDYSWQLFGRFFESKGSPEWRNHVIKMCKRENWISKDYYERAISTEPLH